MRITLNTEYRTFLALDPDTQRFVYVVRAEDVVQETSEPDFAKIEANAWRYEQRALPMPNWRRHPLRWARWHFAWVETYEEICARHG